MDELTKLLRKIPKRDRFLLKEVIATILRGEGDSLHPKKLSGYNHIFRVRVGQYRIIYFWDSSKLIIKTVRKRDESTYKNL